MRNDGETCCNKPESSFNEDSVKDPSYTSEHIDSAILNIRHNLKALRNSHLRNVVNEKANLQEDGDVKLLMDRH